MTKKNPLPDIGDIIFLMILGLVLSILPNYLLGDGSTGWHLVSGQYILQTHSIPHYDLISYTHSHAPWVAYEWLFDLIAASLVKIGSLKALAVVCASIIATVMLLLYERCRKSGLNFPLALFIVIVGAFASSVHWLARPHIFTFVGVYIFATTCEAFYRQEINKFRFLITLSICMLFWVNLHPAFIIGFIQLFIYFVCSGFALLIKSADITEGNYLNQRFKFYGLSLLILIVVSLINPYGPALFEYISHYLHNNQLLSVTDEFKSPVFNGSLQTSCLEIIMLLVVLGLTFAKKRASLPQLFSCLAFWHLALSSTRNIPLFVIVALPFIADLLGKVQTTAASLLVKDPVDTKAKSKTKMILIVIIALLCASFSNELQKLLMPLWTTLSHIWTQYHLYLIPAIILLIILLCIIFNKQLERLIISATKKWQETRQSFDEIEAQCQMHLIPIIAVVILFYAAVNNGYLFGKQILTSDFSTNSKPSKTLDYIVSHHLPANQGFNFDNWGGFITYKLGIPVFIDDRADFYGQKFYLEYSNIMYLNPGWKDIIKKYGITWIVFPKESTLCNYLKTDPNWELACQDQASMLFIKKPDEHLQ